jgi:hypothetical protein
MPLGQPKDELITIEITHTSGGYYAVCLNDRILTKQTLAPRLTAARILLKEGVDPSTLIQMKRKGDQTIAMRASIGIAAGLTVRETKTEGPMFVRYTPPSLKVVAQNRAIAATRHARAQA